MYSQFILVSLLATSSLIASGQLTPPDAGTVTGHVYCADSQTPCRFASVTMQSAPPTKTQSSQTSPAPPSHTYSAATDINGAFQINGVVQGEYYILGRLPGYLSPYDIVSSEFHDKTAPAEALDAALPRTTVEAGKVAVANLTLARGASLGGTVRYDDGGPAINLAVALFRKDQTGSWKPYSNGSADSELAPLGLGPRTDDRGRFYEPALPPGAYVVEVNLPETSLLPSTISGPQFLSVTLSAGDALLIFNGNKNRLADAPAIELKEGEDRPDVDITIMTNGLRSLRGVVATASGVDKITQGSVHLLDPNDGSELRNTTLQEDGSFLFKYVPDGNYRIRIDGQGKTSVRYASLTVALIVQGDVADLSYSLAVAQR